MFSHVIYVFSGQALHGRFLIDKGSMCRMYGNYELFKSSQALL